MNVLFRVIRLKRLLLSFSIAVLTVGIAFTGWQYYNRSAAVSGDKFIKWVDFHVPADLMYQAYQLDVKSHNENAEVKFNFVEMIAYLAARNGSEFQFDYKKELTALTEKLKDGRSMEELTADLKLYDFYYESYDAIFAEYIGEHKVEVADENGNKTLVDKYGIKAFSPIAKGYYYAESDDYGAARSYGFKRKHLGHDMMGSVGTPIIAVESGIVEVAAWNQYGGWRIGIRSFDGKRYYYYAHLRKDKPFHSDISEGKIVKAGDVIGYLGMTGYSTKENVNNINTPHLHFGIQLIFDESQKDGNGEIWIDPYPIVQFLRKVNCSAVEKADGEFYRKYEYFDEYTME